VKPDFHILIVGGGMVGACMAALAAANAELADLRIALLEPNPPTAPPPDRDVHLRVSAVSRASERILDAVGAWSSIAREHLSPYEDMVVWDADGRPSGAGSIHFSAAETGEPNLGYIVENRRLQWAIYESAPFRSRVTVLRAELSALDLAPERATATFADGRRINALLVVGADGASSQSRTLAGIQTAGWEYEQRAFVTHVRTEHPHRRTAWQRFLAHGPIAFLPLADGRSSIVWTTRPEHAEQLVDDPAERLERELHDAIDGTLGRIEATGARAQFPLRLMHARNYCAQRFVLIGDAAHAVHPLAGQGVNLGFLDAAALVETLAQELTAGGSEAAIAELRGLRRYERWRKSENLLALGLIDGLNRLFSTANPVFGNVRRTGLSMLDRSRFAKRFLMGRALGTAGELPKLALQAR
jgi:2-polyprenylphenol 6-hydroxylase